MIIIKNDKKFVITEENIRNFWLQVEKTDSCWIWKGYKWKQGYGRISFRKDGKYVVFKASRFSYILHNKKQIPTRKVICHSCDNPPCVNPKHLWLGTQSQNVQDALRKNRWNPANGERHGLTKLTTKKVLKIRELYNSGEFTQKKLAERFKLHPMHVFQLIHKLRWIHI